MVASAGSKTRRGAKGENRAKKAWRRDRHVTRSIARRTAEGVNESALQEDTPDSGVNSVVEVDPEKYGESMRSQRPE